MTPDELYTQAKESPVLSKEVTDTLLESLEYSSISFLNQAVEILGIFRARLERGDRITVEASGDVLNLKSFRKFVENTSVSYTHLSSTNSPSFVSCTSISAKSAPLSMVYPRELMVFSGAISAPPR